MSTLGERIKEQRKQLGLTQAELGRIIHVTDRAVSKWEQDEGNPDISIIAQLASTLNVTIDYLLTGKEPEIKIIIKSPKEILLETDDPQYLEKVSIYDFNIMDIYNNKLTNTFSYLVDNNRIGTYVPNSDYNRYIPQITYLLLISNRLDRVKIFNFNDFGFWDDHEITEEMLNEFVSDERVNDKTRNYVLTIHCRELISINQGPSKNTETYHPYGNWKSLYPRILNKFVEIKRWDWVDRMLDLITELKVIAIQNNILNTLLDEEQYDLLDKANKINESLGITTLSQRTIDIHKMRNSNAPLKEKLVFEFVQNGILNYDGLLKRQVEIDGIDRQENIDKRLEVVLKTYGNLYHEILMEYPISLIELTYKSVSQGKLKTLFQLAVDYKIHPLIDALIEGDTEKIISVAKNSFIYTETKFVETKNTTLHVGRTVYKIGDNWVTSEDIPAGLMNIADLSEIPEKISDAIKYFDKNKENIFEKWKNKSEDKIESRKKAKMDFNNYNRIQNNITVDYLNNEIANGNIDNAKVKACSKLENILEYLYHYEGQLYDMLKGYFADRIISIEKPYDSEDTETLKELNQKYKYWKDLLTRLRISRDNYSHENDTPVEFSVEDLKNCIQIIEAIKVEGEM